MNPTKLSRWAVASIHEVYERMALRAVLVVAVALTTAGGAQAVNTIDAHVFSAGAGLVTSPTLEAFTLIGETLTGPATGATHSVQAGFVAAVVFEGILDAPMQERPSVSGIQGVRPNPFRGKATIVFDVAHQAHFDVRMFDASGRLVQVLANGQQGPGRHVVEWDGMSGNGRRVNTGVFYCRFTCGSILETRRMVFIK